MKNTEFEITKAVDSIFPILPSSLSQESVQKIFDRLPELVRAKKSIGRRNSQTTSILQTLNMISDGPFRQMKQCLSQIGNKRDALTECFFNIEKKKLAIKEWQEVDSEMSRLLINETESQITRTAEGAEQALKEMGMYQDLYDKIMKENNIPVDWDEADFEEAEVSNHLHLCFRQVVQDVIVNGRVSKGVAEYLEQYGVNPVVGNYLTVQWVNKMQEECETGKYPSVKEMHKFLDEMAETFKDEHKHCLSRMGVDKIVSADYIYREGEKKNE
jgi:hypothetical protein